MKMDGRSYSELEVSQTNKLTVKEFSSVQWKLSYEIRGNRPLSWKLWYAAFLLNLPVFHALQFA